MPFVLRGYYAILDLPGRNPRGPNDFSRAAKARLAARPACMQLRAKRMGAADLRRTAALLLPACRAAGVPLLVNDRLDVALAVARTGSISDRATCRCAMPCACAPASDSSSAYPRTIGRRRRPPRATGPTTSASPIFATQSKADAEPPVGLERLREVCAAVSFPVVAIGGITLANVEAVAATGASAAAIIAAIDHARDPVAGGEAGSRRRSVRRGGGGRAPISGWRWPG